MDLLASLLPLLPLLAGAAALGFGWSRLTAMAAVLGSAGVLAGGIVLSVATVGGDVVGTGGGLIRVDPLSAFMLVVIGIAAVISTGYAVSYVGAELSHGHITPSTGRSS
ncbi:MAG: proton-conducting transporter membrane subunit, partial [Acidimicrobiia bacterium]